MRPWAHILLILGALLVLPWAHAWLWAAPARSIVATSASMTGANPSVDAPGSTAGEWPDDSGNVLEEEEDDDGDFPEAVPATAPAVPRPAPRGALLTARVGASPPPVHLELETPPPRG